MRSTLTIAAALTALFTATYAPAQAKKPAAKAPDACKLLTTDEIKTSTETAVQPGTPGKDDCTWKDAKGQDRVYVSIRDGYEWKSMRDQMQVTGRLAPVTGIAEDAFYVSSTGSSAVLYVLKHRHAVLITVTGDNFSKAQNEGAEKTLAVQILSRL